MSDELNPNHEVTAMARDNWHKVVGILMEKFKQTAVEITTADLDAMGHNEKAVVMDARGGKLVIRLMSMAEGERLARREGGLPV